MNVLRHWKGFEDCVVTPIDTGLINSSYRVVTRPFILQRLNKIFDPIVHEDINAITNHLKSSGIVTPMLVPTKEGKLYVIEEGECWRLQTCISGESHHFLKNEKMAHSAGSLVAQFHSALSNVSHNYNFVRSNVHDTKRYLTAFSNALSQYEFHRYFGDVDKLANEISLSASNLPDFSTIPLRHSHGDLKVSNILFEEDSARCLVDLDTLGLLQWPLEMGDALRSWCNPTDEGDVESRFDVKYFAAAVEGYFSQARSMLSDQEIKMLIPGLQTILLELSVRFLTDALEEKYFGYDINRFSSRGEHNLIRGIGQWNLYRQVHASRSDLQDIVWRCAQRGE